MLKGVKQLIEKFANSNSIELNKAQILKDLQRDREGMLARFEREQKEQERLTRERYECEELRKKNK